MSGFVFGIDLGTTNSACARATVGDHRIDVMQIDPASSHDKTLLPSRILLRRNEDDGITCYVGRLAYQRHVEASSETDLYIEAAKREIGLQKPQVWPFFGDLTLDPTDVAALVLRKVVAEVTKTGVDSLQAVITHPRDFQSMQKAATAEAAVLAGIRLVETIDEPVAALYSWYRPDAPPEPGYYGVFDLGGGTLDIAIMEVRRNAHPVVIGGHGEPRLGGRDWDQVMYEQLASSIRARYPSLDANSLDLPSQARLGELAEELKREEGVVNHQRRVRLRTQVGQDVELDLQVTREVWSASARGLVDRCRQAVGHALEQSNVQPDQLKKLIPAGGGTRLRMVRDALKVMFGDRFLDPNQNPEINLDHAIARGAARFGSYLLATSQQTARTAKLAPITTTLAHGLNVEIKGNETKPLLTRGRTLPASEEKRFQVASPGGLKVRIHEGEPGPLAEDAPCALDVGFDVQAELGDQVLVRVDAEHSGRISFVATHLRTGECRDGHLRYDGDGPTATNDLKTRRKKKLNSIKVL